MSPFKQNPSLNDTHKVGKNTYKWNGKAWKIDSSGLTGSISTTERTEFIATQGQDTFNTEYSPGYIDVYLNGVHLNSDDYTAMNGTSITLAVPAAVDDELYVLSYGKFVVDDHYDKSQTNNIINNKINELIDTAPANLDTLNELAQALNDDADFAGTVTTALSGKAASSHTHSIGEVTNLQTELDDIETLALAGL